MIHLIERFAAALLIVIPLIWLVVWFYSKQSGMGLKGKRGMMKVLTNMPLGPKKAISIVDVAGEYLVLGVTSEQITFLTNIDDDLARQKLDEGLRSEEADKIGRLLKIKNPFITGKLKSIIRPGKNNDKV